MNVALPTRDSPAIGRSGVIHPPSVADLLRRASRYLRRHGVDDSLREARLLLGHVCGRQSIDFFLDSNALVPRQQRREFYTLVLRRSRHEPFSRICGQREFWSLAFAINPHTLDPRPDSETLIEAVMDHFSDPSLPHRILDLGTGSGCLILALLSEFTHARGIGVDRYGPTLIQARSNATRLGYESRVRFIQADWLRAIRGRFDIILANPPYIPTADIKDLSRSVRDYDPRAALDGGCDGMREYRRFLPDIKDTLADGGRLFLEIDPRLDTPLQRLITDHNLAKLSVRRDIGARKRCVIIAVISAHESDA